MRKKIALKITIKYLLSHTKSPEVKKSSSSEYQTPINVDKLYQFNNLKKAHKTHIKGLLFWLFEDLSIF